MRCKDVYFWRQILILFGDCLHSVGTGFLLSFSSVLNPALLSPNTTDIRATPEEVSWISASLGLAGFVGFLVIPPLFKYFGRKAIHIALNFLLTAGFLVLYFANSVRMLFLGKFLQGLDMGSVAITIFIIAEYSHPKRRGYFVTIKKASLSFGSLICHSLYLSMTWRQIALLAVAPYTMSTILILFWPESPAYLAINGKYDECDKSHTWLFGSGPKAKKDLDKLITAQRERRNKPRKTGIQMMKRTLGKFTQKDFLKPFVIVTILSLMIEACGRYYMMLYVIEIVIEVTGDTLAGVYCSIVADIFTMLAFVVSGFLVRKLSRRNILIYFGFATSAIMYILSLVIFLKSYNIGADLNWLTPALIVLNTFINYIGVIPTAFTVISEIYPLEHKVIASFSTGLTFTGLYAVTIKIIPTMIARSGVEGMFAIFATCLLLCTIWLCFYLIETKDRTLQDIEDEIKGIDTTQSELLRKSTIEDRA